MRIKIEAEIELTPAVGRYEPADLHAALAAWFKAQHVKVLKLDVETIAPFYDKEEGTAK